MENEWTREIERLRAENAALTAEYRREYCKLARALGTKAAENAELTAEIERLKKPKGFHDVSDLYDDGITGRQWMIEQEASHE